MLSGARCGSWVIAAILLLTSSFSWAEEYSFEIPGIEKKPYRISGYLELKPVLHSLDKDAAFYKLKFFDREADPVLQEYDGTFRLDASYEKGIARVSLSTNTELSHTYLGWSTDTTLYEGYLSLKPAASLAIDAGKKRLKWGTGYAWNPAAFLDRPKDPDDPELALEGYTVVSADYIMSFSGPLRTLSLTPVLMPVYDHLNDDFGQTGKVNVAGRLYLLMYDTDVDFTFLSGGSRTARYGFDFSRNLAANFEVHGEASFINDDGRRVIDAEGNLHHDMRDATNVLLGFRYLTESEVTWIVEYYRNGSGYSRGEMEDFFSFVERGYERYKSSGEYDLLKKARLAANSGYGRPNVMKDYLYARLSVKEPFDLLYVTPALTVIMNVDDNSLSVSPEFVYSGITNLEFRLKADVLIGRSGSEYGEKQNEYRAELYARYYF